MHHSAHDLESNVTGRLVNYGLTVGLINWLKEHEDILADHPEVDVHHVYKSQTVREFDQRLIVPLFGMRSCLS